MRRTTRFRQLLNAPEILLLPGVHDALSVRLAEHAGFDAITCGGYSATASLLGRPDTSLLTMSEMADMYARLCDASPLPLFADADTGFGNVTNTGRAVRAYERAGVAGLFIEDQVYPKRCGHMAGKDVVPVEEFLAKLKAGVLDVCVSSAVFQDGVNVPNLASVVVATGYKSTIATLQRLGRGSRVTEDKTTFEVWDIADEGAFGSKHTEARHKAYTREGYDVTFVAQGGLKAKLGAR